RRVDPLEPGSHVDEIGERLRLPALRLLEAHFGGCEERIDHVARFGLPRLGEPARGPTPCDPELLPASRIVARDPLHEQRLEQGGAVRVARFAESWPDRETGKQPERTLVVR